MRKSDRVFTPTEVRIAGWVIAAAAIVTLLAIALEGVWFSPPLGRYGMDNVAAAAPQGILDAQPMNGAV